MFWTEQKGRRYEQLRRQGSKLTEDERAELATLTKELEGSESAIANDDHADPKTRSWTWLWPVVAGMVIGSVLLAPFVRSFGDPSGQTTGAGWGGFFGLAVALLRRFVARE